MVSVEHKNIQLMIHILFAAEIKFELGIILSDKQSNERRLLKDMCAKANINPPSPISKRKLSSKNKL